MIGLQTKNNHVPHMNIINENKGAIAMENLVRYDHHTYPADKFSVIFEFPPKSELDQQVEMEVKSIMAGAMKEHLSRPS